MSTTQKTTFCRICENQCGLRVSLDGERITHIEPDTEHVASRGYACIKGLSFQNMRDNPDRITTPMKRDGERWHAISWQQAFQEIGRKVRQLRGDHGDDSLGLYFGNPISFSPLMPIFFTGFAQGLGTRKLFTTGSLDCNNKFLVSQHMYGSPMALTFPDIDHLDCLIMLGSNPSVSKMSFINLPDPVRRLKAIEARGGSVIHINPRRTETAKALGEQCFIRPDTDVFFLAAFLRELFEQGAVDRKRASQFMEGLEELEALVSPWTAERQAAVTGISADSLRKLVQRYGSAKGAALYGSTGINQGSNGSVAFWLLECINAVSGNLDKRGGSLMGRGIFDYAKATTGADDQVFHSRIGHTRSFLGTLPTPLLADEILEEGQDRIRGLFVIAGNPLLTSTNSRKTAKALASLELLVAVDILRNETAEYAHYFLPGTHFSERPDIPFTSFSFCGLMPEPWFQYTDALLPPPGDCRDESWIIRQLAKHCRAPLFGSRLLQGSMNIGEKLGQLPGLGARLTPMPERLLGLISRAGKLGGLGALRKHPHGIALPAIDGNSYLGKRVLARNGKVQLAPALLVNLANERLADRYEQARQSGDGFKLITKRERFSHNSWTHNDPAYIKGKRRQNYLYIHPDDAQKLGANDGEEVEVSNEIGAVIACLAVSDDLMPGTVALPHGWGHESASGLSVARKTCGVNANILAADGPDAIEPVSGMAKFNGIAVNIRSTRTATAQKLGQ